jgi:hypothetical protein
MFLVGFGFLPLTVFFNVTAHYVMAYNGII